MSEGSPGRRLTLDDLNRFLGLENDYSAGLTAYLDAAAVLEAFDPFLLRPAGDVPDLGTSVMDQLLSQCETITQGPGRGLWSLSLLSRRASFRRLATRERMQEALRANPDRTETILQLIFEQVVDGQSFILRDASREELVALLTVHGWLDGVIDDLPGQPSIIEALVRFDFLEPMRRLAGGDFVGREQELQHLQDYVLGSEENRLGSSRAPDPAPPLFVYGPGGVGKSTLLARFILNQFGSSNLRCVYIDLDRPTIRPDTPGTLLLEVISQLQAQLDLATIAVNGLIRQISYEIRREDLERTFESASSADGYLQQFATVLGPLLGDSILLVVIDTFEEVQFLGPDVVWLLAQFFLQLGGWLPNLRLILSGRALPLEYLSLTFPAISSQLAEVLPDDPIILDNIPMPNRPINLGMLDDESARDLLRACVARAGLPRLRDDELDAIVGVVSRNPMCLKLAARLLSYEDIGELRSSRGEVLIKLRAEKIQALLYGRILSHVHADDVRSIAFPGLIVRRITPDVIREVLAGPCGLELTPERNEYSIFEDLWNESALVQADPEDGSLRHRNDVRRTMLEDLTDRVRPDVVTQIDQNAVSFYSRQSDPINRAEEIYHRLRLQEPSTTLDERWMPEAADRLKNAAEELPAQQQLWLAQKLGITLDASVRSTASQEAWEDQAARSASRYLQSDAPEAALEVLQERSARLPGSRLYFLETEARRFLDQPDAALRVARAGIDVAGKAGNIDMALELLLQMAVIEEGRGDPEAAAQRLDEASATAPYSSDDVLRFRVLITRLRLERHLHPGGSEVDDDLRRQALAQLTDRLLEAIQARPVLLRETAAEIGDYDPRITSVAIETLGIEVTSDTQAQALGQAIATLAETHQPVATLEPVFVEGAQEFRATNFDASVVRRWATQGVTSRDVRSLGATLAAAEPETEVLMSFRTYFQAGVDEAIQRHSAGD